MSVPREQSTTSVVASGWTIGYRLWGTWRRFLIMSQYRSLCGRAAARREPGNDISSERVQSNYLDQYSTGCLPTLLCLTSWQLQDQGLILLCGAYSRTRRLGMYNRWREGGMTRVRQDPNASSKYPTNEFRLATCQTVCSAHPIPSLQSFSRHNAAIARHGKPTQHRVIPQRM